MPNIVITSTSDRILVAFNDLTTQAGMPSGNWDKSTVATEMNLGNVDVFFIVQNLQQWRFSYNGSANSLQVDSVNGDAPTNNVDLKSKIDAILQISEIPDQTGNAGKFLTTDGSVMSWAASSGGVSDGDKGDITVSVSGSVWTIDNLAVTNDKINDVSATKVTEDSTHRFATDAEKSSWNTKLDSSGNGSALTGLTKTQVGLANVDNTSDANKPISTATQSALDSKQETLVSSTNIKTINGSSVLGSGNLTVSSGYHFVGTLAGDQATGANVTPVTLTGLVFSYAANSKYRIWAMGTVQPAAATTGCGFQFDLSSAVTAISVQFFHQLANTGTLSGGHSISDDASVGVSSGMPATSTYPVTVEGLLVTGANTGTAQLRFRSETTAVTTCKAGFTLVVEKIA